MVSRSYLVETPKRPSRPKLFFDQTMVPALIDLAGGAESLLERLAIRTRTAPGLTLAMAFGLGALLSVAARPRRP